MRLAIGSPMFFMLGSGTREGSCMPVAFSKRFIDMLAKKASLTSRLRVSLDAPTSSCIEYLDVSDFLNDTLVRPMHKHIPVPFLKSIASAML
jgi:hypothetical protein